MLFVIEKCKNINNKVTLLKLLMEILTLCSHAGEQDRCCCLLLNKCKNINNKVTFETFNGNTYFLLSGG